MTTRIARISALGLVAVTLTSMVAVGVTRGQESQKHVLMLSEYRPESAPNFFALIRSGVEAEYKERLNYFTEYIDAQTFGEEDYLLALRDFFRRKYRRQRFDVVIVVGKLAAEFVKLHGREVFQDVPTVAALPLRDGAELFDNWTAKSPITGVVDRIDPKGTLEFILQLRPDTKRVILIAGVSKFDASLERFTKRELVEYESAVELTYWVGLPLETLLARVATLGPETALMYLMVSEDQTGRRLLSEDVLANVTKVATAPVYGVLYNHLERGIVGGQLTNAEIEGPILADIVLRILRGERAQDIPVRLAPNIVPMANWRQLRRWGISESRLPQGTMIRYRDPSPWELYRGYIVGAMVMVSVQSLLIGWLLVERRHRRRAEVEAREHLEKARQHLVAMTHLDRRAAMGEVTAAIAHELNQPIEAILHNAEAAEMMLDAGAFAPAEMRQILADIRRIDVRAGDIIQRMRGMLRKHDFQATAIDANDFTRETLAIVAPVAASKGVRLELDLGADLPPIVGDQIHLQQVLLNLLLNGIDATAAMPPERRSLLVRTEKTGEQVHVSVSDAGHGIPDDALARIFEPFYTTKGEGMGIGLSIARTIVEAHGGSIAARNNPEGGATVWFSLPVGVAA